MKSSLRHRALAVIAGGAVALSTAVAVSPVASASPSNEVAAARWLDHQLVDGLAVFENWTGAVEPDYGTSLDILQSLKDLGTKQALQTKILDAVVGKSAEFLGSPVSAGRAAKLALAVSGQGGDPTSVAGVNLVEEIEDQTEAGVTTGATSGFSHAFVTRVLIQADSAEAQESLTSLLAQQCADGGFKTWDAQCPTAIDVDTTAVALEALVEAKKLGRSGLDGAISSSTNALLKAQASDGSYTAEYFGPNANTTGLAAKALAIGGKAAAATKAARWIAKHQLTDATATGKLAGHAGAIAYNQAALTAGAGSGIEAPDLGQWLSATAQAAPALALIAPTKATVALPKFARSGGVVKVRAYGLEPGWKSKATVPGGSTATVVVPSNGRVTFNLRLPKGTATRTITVTNAAGTKIATSKVRVLAAKKLSTKVAKKKVKKRKVQRVVVRGFVPREPVRVYYRGKLVKRGVASSKGNFAYRFRVGTKVGKAKVTVYGAYANRKGVKTFRVVK